MDTQKKIHKDISRTLFFILINVILSPAYAGYYLVSSGVNPETVQCCDCCPPPTHPSSHHHKKQKNQSHYQIDVYYVWYTYSGNRWIPSSCGTCGAPQGAIKRRDCQFVYTPANVSSDFYRTQENETYDNIDTRTLDDTDDRY